jgi:hypothetical protein
MQTLHVHPQACHFGLLAQQTSALSPLRMYACFYLARLLLVILLLQAAVRLCGQRLTWAPASQQSWCVVAAQT